MYHIAYLQDLPGFPGFTWIYVNLRGFAKICQPKIAGSGKKRIQNYLTHSSANWVPAEYMHIVKAMCVTRHLYLSGNEKEINKFKWNKSKSYLSIN